MVCEPCAFTIAVCCFGDSQSLIPCYFFYCELLGFPRTYVCQNSLRSCFSRLLRSQDQFKLLAQGCFGPQMSNPDSVNLGANLPDDWLQVTNSGSFLHGRFIFLSLLNHGAAALLRGLLNTFLILGGSQAASPVLYPVSVQVEVPGLWALADTFKVMPAEHLDSARPCFHLDYALG